MSISIEFERTENYLFVVISGEWTTIDAVNVLDNIKKEAEIHGMKNILLDLHRLSRPNSEMTRYFSGKKIASTFSSHYKIAGYTQSEKINKFGENTAVNRGAFFRIFNCESDAINWLLS